MNPRMEAGLIAAKELFRTFWDFAVLLEAGGWFFFLFIHLITPTDTLIEKAPSWTDAVIVTTVLAIPCAALALLYGVNTYGYEVEKAVIRRRAQPHLAESLRARITFGHDVEIVGPAAFRDAVVDILDKLRAGSPQEYEKALKYMPIVRFKSDLGSWARSDGYFSIDDENPHFPWVFLHELGHNVLGREQGNWSEDGATSFANTVFGSIQG